MSDKRIKILDESLSVMGVSDLVKTDFVEYVSHKS